MDKNDVYAISGRIKNIIAREDVALSPVGTVLVNYFTLVLKDLYDFADTLEDSKKEALFRLLRAKEDTPLHIIQVATPKEKAPTLYEEFTKAKPQFNTNEEALDHFIKEYDDLGSLYGMSGDDFWLEAEDSSYLNEDHIKIMRLQRQIQMCKHLIKRDRYQ